MKRDCKYRLNLIDIRYHHKKIQKDQKKTAAGHVLYGFLASTIIF